MPKKLLFGLILFIHGQSAWFGRKVRAEQDNWIIEVAGNCSCVLYYLCGDDGYIKTDGAGLLDERGGSAQNLIACSGEMLVCCKRRPAESSEPPSTTLEPTPSPTTTTVVELFKSPKEMKCGTPRTTIDMRVLAGDDGFLPIDGEFPWMAAIYSRDSSQWRRRFSGSLIHPQAVLTAAHAVPRHRKNDFRVIVNGLIQQSAIGSDASQERAVKAVLRHPDFSSGTLYNDVAVLVLDEPYNLTGSAPINTICLHPNVSYVGKKCLVAGWGVAPISSDEALPILKKVELTTHSVQKCEEMLRNTHLGANYRLHESFLCAGGEPGKDACRGDGGGPLVCPNGSAIYQAGIVAFGIGCGKEGIPGVYADVAYLYEWIVDTLKQQHNITV